MGEGAGLSNWKGSKKGLGAARGLPVVAALGPGAGAGVSNPNSGLGPGERVPSASTGEGAGVSGLGTGDTSTDSRLLLGPGPGELTLLSGPGTKVAPSGPDGEGAGVIEDWDRPEVPGLCAGEMAGTIPAAKSLHHGFCRQYFLLFSGCPGDRQPAASKAFADGMKVD